MTEKNSLIFIEHILENISKIEVFSKSLSKSALTNSDEKQYAIVRAIEVIGEAVKNLPEEFRKKYSQIQWNEIVGTRDKLIHHYFGIDLDIIWKIIKEDIPNLKEQIEQIKSQEKLI